MQAGKLLGPASALSQGTWHAGGCRSCVWGHGVITLSVVPSTGEW